MCYNHFGSLKRHAKGLSFEAVGGAGTAILNKFLVTSYDFGMFSSRVSGVRPEDEDGKTQGGQAQDGTYYDESLTGYRISENINYLYGAELEYLLAGHNSSQDNLNTSRNIICGVRLTMKLPQVLTDDSYPADPCPGGGYNGCDYMSVAELEVFGS